MESRAVKWIAKLLGAIWLFDGILQFQPGMFGKPFVTNILVPLTSGQPSFMVAIVNAGSWLWNTNTVVTNTLAALLQVAIGVMILFPLTSKTFKIGLWVSIVWGVIVWLCGEGLGLLLTGNASFYTGAPGAVAIYVLLAVLLLKREKISTHWYPKILGWICVFGAALQLQPSLWNANGVMTNFMPAMSDPIHALNMIPNWFVNLTAHGPVASNVILALILLVIGLMLILKPNKMTGVIALVFLFLVWWVGQDFGQLSTVWSGTPTDPNAAPLLAILLVPLFVRMSSMRNSAAPAKAQVSYAS